MSGAIESPAFRYERREREADAFGMWIFLGSEAMLFGAVILIYMVARIDHPKAFAAASGHLSIVLGTANTAVLITSSFAMAAADLLARLERWRAAAWALAITAALGVAFLVIKGTEYVQEIHEGIAPVLGLPFGFDGPDPRGAQLFFELYFATTSLHAAHLLSGIVAVVVILTMWGRSTGASCMRRSQAIGLYWHFIDIVWVFLFPILYLVDR
jgi:cytochrome c oxidase subunit 3